MNQITQDYPSEYPYAREWCGNSIDIKQYVTLKENWDKSKELINSIRKCLNNAEIHPVVKTVAAAGSLGRMEASQDVSDADLIIVLSDNTELDSPEAENAYNSVWKALESLTTLTIRRPKDTGVFADPTNQKQLLGDVGKADESMKVFGKRLLLLLETQPVYGDESYAKLLNVIVDRYADKYVQREPQKEWTFLLNDLIRYFRAICVNYQWDFDNEAGKWPLRNVKLRHSRIVMYSGLLMLLGEASKERRNKVDWLKERLKMTPLERLEWVYEQNKDWNFHRIAEPYNVFLYQISIPQVRTKLNVDPAYDNREDEDSYKKRYDIPEFSALKANSNGLIAELWRFLLARRGSWTEEFFEYLIF
ncbi:hypothetical protein [Argonema galeatum]|uniref:hypothetical protein n=1 Tax=Argonema galeatum TaxID=2942762 RepID=UPI0020128463|nr:hypothetical protein [Argonema galeatum]MCL1464948.1 hypothetical protein [Argonema galeatum A003/A1]